jgi:hypothetical protein
MGGLRAYNNYHSSISFTHHMDSNRWLNEYTMKGLSPVPNISALKGGNIWNISLRRIAFTLLVSVVAQYIVG